MSPDTNDTAPYPQKGRRRLLLGLSWTGLSLFAATSSAAVIRFFWPRVSTRPARSFQVGFPDDHRPGQVLDHPGRKLFVVRDDNGFFSLSARCTHLGCIVAWNDDYQMFLCPCHGGKYDAEGRNIEGPPPRPLDQFALEQNDNGQLVVDLDNIIKREKGAVPRFRPGAA